MTETAETIMQGMARRKFSGLTQLARESGIVPPKAAHEGCEKGQDTHVMLPGKSFMLGWGITGWKDQKGPAVNASLIFGGDGTIRILWDAEDGWRATIRVARVGSLEADKIVELAKSFHITAAVNASQPLMQQEADVIAENFFKHFLKNG